MTKIYHFFNTKTSDKLRTLTNGIIEKHALQLFIKRDDLLHPEVSGNKWRKLKYNLLKAEAENQTSLLTLGGAFSNHISATAAAGKLFNFKTIGIIRGEKPTPLNPTLAFAEKCGMELHFISRTLYRTRNESSFLKNLKNEFGEFYFLPEGGTNPLAIKGCGEIVDELKKEVSETPDFICVPVGTGGTAAGVINTAAEIFPDTQILCFPALKGDFLQKEMNLLTSAETVFNKKNWQIRTGFEFGGYAKWDRTLIDFINQFKNEFQIPIDPIYTGKMFFGIFKLIEKGFFPKGSKIVAIHTGGLQGIKGFNHRFGEIISGN